MPAFCPECSECAWGCEVHCGDCPVKICHQCEDDDFDADELGLDPEEEYDA